MYGNVADDKNTGEMSRFMLQLLVESGHVIARKNIISGQLPTVKVYNEQLKTPAVMSRLNDLNYISPTAINRFIKCPLQFFYNMIAGIKEPDTEGDEIDGRIFGNIFHDASQMVYEQIMGVTQEEDRKMIEKNGFKVEKKHLEQILSRPDILERTLDIAFANNLFKIDTPQEKPEYNGLQLINRKVILHYLRQLLEMDKQMAPFVIRGLERDVYDTIHLNTANGEKTVRIGGRIDRLDEIVMEDGSRQIRVIDYKTGNKTVSSMDDVEAVFSPKNISKHSEYYLQAMLYAMIVSKSQHINPESLPVGPALLFIQHIGGKDYCPVLKIGKEPINDISVYIPVFEEKLKEVLTQMIEPTLPFIPTEDRKMCNRCPYSALCGNNEIRK